MRNGALRSGVFAMSFLSNDERVRQEAKAVLRGQAAQSLPFVTPAATKLTAVNFTPRRFSKIRDLIADFDSYLRAASAAASPFVAFPELTGLVTLGTLPRAKSALCALREELSDPETGAQAAKEAVQLTQGCVGEIFLNLFSELARTRKLLIAAGGFYVLEGDCIRNRQYLFSETGEVLIHQDKLILSETERRLGVVPCGVLTPADTRIGKIALLTASCARHYEPFFACAALGCRIVAAGASPFGEDASLLHCRAAEEALCVVSPGLLGGEDFSLSFSSPAEIHTPRAAPRPRREKTEIQKTLTSRTDLSAGGAALDHFASDRNTAFFSALLERKDPL